MQKSNFRPEIEGIRALAVAAVFSFHYQVPGFQAGFLGVDIFLVVSGFVITAMLEDERSKTGKVDIARFFTRRARRLLPAMLTTIALSLAAGFLLFNDKHFLDLGNSALASVAGVPNIYFWLNSGYFSIDSDVRPLLHLWSIGVEIQVYLLWPLQFFISSKRGRVALIGFLMAISILAAQFWTGDRDTVFYLTPFRVFEFACGALLVHLRPPTAKLAPIIFVAGITAMVVSLLFLGEKSWLPGFRSLAPVLGCALAIYAGRCAHAQIILANWPMLYFGGLSYCLYLVHWPVAIFWQYVRYQAMGVSDWLFAAAATIILAMLLQKFVETPLRKNTARLLRPTEWKGYLAAAVILLASASVVTGSDGLPFRIDGGGLTVQPGGYEHCAYPLCLHPDQAGRYQLVVVGDSHARHLWPGLDRLAKEHGFGFAVFHFDKWCRPTNEQNLDQGYDCKERLKTLADFLVRNRPTHMLFAVRWINYDGPTGDRLRAIMKEPEWSSVRSIAVMLNVPEFYRDRDPAGCLVPNYVLNPLGRCSDAKRDDPFFKAQEQRNETVRAQFPDIPVFDPFAVFCGRSVCRQAQDGAFLYADKSHMTDAASIELMRYYESPLAEWLSK